MRGTLEKNLEVRASVNDVFRFLSDASNWTIWPADGKVPGIAAASGHLAKGAVIRFTTTDGAEHEHHVIELIPDRKISLHLRKVGPPISLFVQEITDNFEFEAIENGTRLNRRFEVRFRPNAIAEMLGRRLFVKQFDRAIETHHARLAEKFSR